MTGSTHKVWFSGPDGAFCGPSVCAKFRSAYLCFGAFFRARVRLRQGAKLFFIAVSISLNWTAQLRAPFAVLGWDISPEDHKWLNAIMPSAVSSQPLLACLILRLYGRKSKGPKALASGLEYSVQHEASTTVYDNSSIFFLHLALNGLLPSWSYKYCQSETVKSASSDASLCLMSVGSP